MTLNRASCGGLLVFLWLTVSVRADEAAPPAPIYITDMSKCQPAVVLSRERVRQMWRLTDYETTGGIHGTLVQAESATQAPAIRLPLGVKGWYKIYIACWDPEFANDGRPLLKIKLSGDVGFRLIDPPPRPDTQEATYLEEIYFDTADLTDRDLEIGKSNGLVSKCTSLAYVKLVPLSAAEAAAAEADRAQTSTRNLLATIDGQSYFHLAGFHKAEDVLDEVGLYQRSDVAKVQWAVSYGLATNYPTGADGAHFMGSDPSAMADPRFLSNDYRRGQYQMHEAILAFGKQNKLPQTLVADAVHQMGLKFDLMFRMGINGGAAGIPFHSSEGLTRFRQQAHDKTWINKASYAQPIVRDLMLGLIADATNRFDADGINLCFVRGPHFLQFEQPVADALAAKFNVDPASLAADDPRWSDARCQIMTAFLGEVRQALDRAGEKRHRRLTLSVWVWPHDQNVWLGKTPRQEGLDVSAWIRTGLVDSLICQEGIDAEYTSLCKEHDCQFILFTGYRGAEAMSPETVATAYSSGVERFASWDTDLTQISSGQWNWLRRIGHRQEMADWPRYNPAESVNLRLKTIDGVDVENGLSQAVFSGG